MRLPSSLQRFLFVLLPVWLRWDGAAAFHVAPWQRLLQQQRWRLLSPTLAAAAHRGRSSSSSPRSSGSPQVRSKRQERVGQLLQAELSQIIQRGVLKLGADPLDAATRQRISIVRVDVSPDLRQARVSVSIRANPRDSSAAGSADDDDGSSSSSGTADDGFLAQRRAYSWLVGNTKPLRHALAQRISHMKICPELTFHKVDVGAAVDVMFLLDSLGEDGSGMRTDLDFSRSPLVALGDDDEGADSGDDLDGDDWEEDEDFF